MATLTTIEGQVYNFNAGSVSAMTDHDIQVPEYPAVTCVYGVPGTVQLKIAETVDGFLGRLNMAGDFRNLNFPSGNKLWVRPSAVASYAAPTPGTRPPAIKTELICGGAHFGVIEDPQAVAQILA